MLAVEIQELAVTQMGFALILKNAGRRKVVPIFIGPLEAYSISSYLESRSNPRPLTHELMSTVLTDTGYRVERVEIHDFNEGTFIARMVISPLIPRPDIAGELSFDARPSDAIAVAVRMKSPIYMAESIYQETEVEPVLLQATGGDKSVSVETSDPFGDDIFLPEEKVATREKRIDVLKRQLDEEIERENYEEAARLRDEIELLQREDKML